MKSGGGKRKGSEYERVIAKFLSKWVTGNDNDLIYWRSPSSGALATLANVTEASGDLIAIKPEGEWLLKIFNVEVKTGYSKADFFKHFKDIKNNEIRDFWVQCQTDATKSSKYGMLIFKKKGHRPVIGVCDKVSGILNTYGLSYLNLIRLEFSDNIKPVNFFDMEYFFEIIKPDMIRNIKYEKEN